MGGVGEGREREEKKKSKVCPTMKGLVQSLVEAMDSLHHLLRGGGVAIGTPHSIRHQPGKRWGSRRNSEGGREGGREGWREGVFMNTYMYNSEDMDMYTHHICKVTVLPYVYIHTCRIMLVPLPPPPPPPPL